MSSWPRPRRPAISSKMLPFLDASHLARALPFASALKDCEAELRAALEDWVLAGLKLRHHLLVIGNVDLDIDLDKEPVREPVDSL